MGPKSYDLNPAEPYIVRTTPQLALRDGTAFSGPSNSTSAYYGEPIQVGQHAVMSESNFRFQVSPRSPNAIQVPNRRTIRLVSMKDKNESSGSRTRNGLRLRSRFLRLHIEPTNYTQEWRTPPLWGVADSAPYMHDGRAETLLEAITMHEGEATGTRDKFLELSVDDRQAIIELLGTLVAPTNVVRPRT